MCFGCEQRHHYCRYRETLKTGFFCDSPRPNEPVDGTGGTTGECLEALVSRLHPSIYDQLAVALYLEGRPYQIHHLVWVRAAHVNLRCQFAGTFDDFRCVAARAFYAWSYYPAGVLVLHLDHHAAHVYKHGREPHVSNAATSLFDLRDNANASLGVIVRGSGNMLEIAILTVYFYPGETDAGPERSRVLRAATAHW